MAYCQIGLQFESFFLITFCVETLKKYLEKQNLKGGKSALVTKS